MHSGDHDDSEYVWVDRIRAKFTYNKQTCSHIDTQLYEVATMYILCWQISASQAQQLDAVSHNLRASFFRDILVNQLNIDISHLTACQHSWGQDFTVAEVQFSC